MTSLFQDIKYGFRKLRQAPGFSIAVIAVLALGIGANTAIYSAVDAAMFRPLPFPQPQQLVSLSGLGSPFVARIPLPKNNAYMSDARTLPVFSKVAAYAIGALNLEAGSQTKRAPVALVSTDFFSTIGRYPLLGRTFTADEETPGGPKAALLSHRVWQQQFGSDPAVIGRTIQLNARPYAIVGVMPAGFRFPNDPDVWIPLPLPMTSDLFEAFKNFIDISYLGRLAPSVSPAQAGIALRSVERRFPSWQYVSDSSATSLVEPLQHALMSRDSRRPLVILMAAAALVLLIACANVANLLLSRATTLQRELAIRSVLGATRARILRQLVIESVMLASAGAVAGLALGFTAMGALRVLLPADVIAISRPELDGRLMAFALVVATIVGVVVGAWPGLQATRRDAGQVIKARGAHGATERGGRLVRATLVVVEMALALVLLIGSGLMIQSFWTMVTSDTGMRPEHVFAAHVTLPAARYPASARNGFYTTVLDRLRSAPGISAAAVTSMLPFDHGSFMGLRVTSPESPAGDTAASNSFPRWLHVTPGYFATIGIPLLRGRDLVRGDDKRDPVIVVNKALADRFWPGQDPLGKHIVSSMVAATPSTVVGVVANARTFALSTVPKPQMYIPLLAGADPDAHFVIRGNLSRAAFAARLRDAVHAVDPHQFVYDGRMMDDVIADSVAPRRTNTLLLSIFGAVALALAAIGVYSVLAYGVSRRLREFGVRAALGAGRGDVLRLVMKQGLVMASVGAAIGLGAAVLLSKLIASQLYQVSPHDPMIFVLAPLALMLIAVVATILPALRATRVDPMEALRAE